MRERARGSLLGPGRSRGQTPRPASPGTQYAQPHSTQRPGRRREEGRDAAFPAVLQNPCVALAPYGGRSAASTRSSPARHPEWSHVSHSAEADRAQRRRRAQRSSVRVAYPSAGLRRLQLTERALPRRAAAGRPRVGHRAAAQAARSALHVVRLFSSAHARALQYSSCVLQAHVLQLDADSSHLSRF